MADKRLFASAVSTLLLTLPPLLLVPGAGRAEPIASVSELVNSAMREPPGDAERTVRLSDELVQQERVETEPKSAVKMVFIDGSELRLDESSQMILTEYVFDPHAQASNGLIKLGTGVFRFVSSGKNDQGVVLQTPAATIGIRGTDILVTTSKTGQTKVAVLEGAVYVQPSGIGIGATVTAGQTVSVDGPDSNASTHDVGGDSTQAGTNGGKTAGDGGGRSGGQGGGPSGGSGGGSSGGSSGGGSSGGGSSGGGDSGGGNSGGGDSGGGNTGGGNTGGGGGNTGGGCPGGPSGSGGSGASGGSAGGANGPAGGQGGAAGGHGGRSGSRG